MKNPKSSRGRHKNSRLPQLLALGGFAILIVVVLIFKQKPPAAPSGEPSPVLAQAQLDQALEAGRPVVAFFHSNSCEQCIIMMNTVAQVFPDYQEAIVLVDVNVYDSQNEALMRRVRLQFIPTLIFYDRSGQSQMHVGVMTPDQFGERLIGLAGGP